MAVPCLFLISNSSLEMERSVDHCQQRCGHIPENGGMRYMEMINRNVDY